MRLMILQPIDFDALHPGSTPDRVCFTVFSAPFQLVLRGCMHRLAARSEPTASTGAPDRPGGSDLLLEEVRL